MSVGSSASNLLGLFQKDPKFRTLHNVKDPAIQQRIGGLLEDYDTNKGVGEAGLSDFISKYLANSPTVERQTKEDIGAVDPFFNGDMAATLQNLRTRREGAVNNAADVASDAALRSLDLAKLSRQGNDSTFDIRSAVAALAPIRVNAAVDTLNQERGDLGYLTGTQLGLMGTRQGMEDQLANRSLIPSQVQSQILSRNESLLNPIEQMNLANNFYGLQKKTTDLDRWQQFLNSQQATMNSDVGTIANAYAGMSGGGGGGGGGGGSSL